MRRLLMFNNLLYYHTGSPRHTPLDTMVSSLEEYGRKWKKMEVTTVGLVHTPWGSANATATLTYEL